MKILVAIDAPINDYSKIKKKASNYDLVIAADGAARHLQALSITPDIIIGDFDSFKSIPKEWKKVELIKYPKQKDVTDGELAINLAVEKGASEIDIIGLTGGYLDHTLANLELLKFIPKNIKVTSFSEDETVYRITGQRTIQAMAGDRLSILNLVGTPKIKTTGLKYNLDNSVLKSPTHGISNEAKGNKINVSISGEGMIMLIAYSRK